MKKILLLFIVFSFLGIEGAIARDKKPVNWEISKKQIKRQRRATHYRKNCNRILQQHLQTFQKPGLGGYFSIAYENFRLRPQKHGFPFGVGK